MTEIKLYPKYFPAVCRGEKTATIRRGIRSYTLGAAVLVDTEDATHRIPVKITDLHIENLKTLIDTDAYRDGFRSVGALVMALRDLYPGVGDYEDLTVVEFEMAEAPALET